MGGTATTSGYGGVEVVCAEEGEGHGHTLPCGEGAVEPGHITKGSNSATTGLVRVV